MKNLWLRFKEALRLQRWPIISDAEKILAEQKRKLNRLYGRKE